MTTLDHSLPASGTLVQPRVRRPWSLGFGRLPLLVRWLFVLAVGTLLGGVLMAPARVFANVLLWGNYAVGLGLGGMFFIAIHDVSGAGWATAFRRVPAAFASLVPFGSALVLVAIFAGGDLLYPWMGGEHLEGFKGLWLSRPFAEIRSVVYVLTWLVFARAFRRSNASDLGGVRRDRRLGAAFLIVFALSVWLSSVDWIMSLEPHWFSTMFGVYRFAGLFSAALAAITIAVIVLRRRGAFGTTIGAAHLHDLGKLMFAFSTFWMYIWFSQYMLIWYSNLAEEAVWFRLRTTNGWGELMGLLVVLNWVIPFIVLLPAAAKMNENVLLRVAAILLVGHWLDLFVQIFPTVRPDLPPVGLLELAAACVAWVAIFLLVSSALRERDLTPESHPLLAESCAHHE